MSQFSIVRKGYRAEEVDMFIDKLTRSRDNAIAEQTSKITKLNDDIAKLKQEIFKYKSREDSVNKAIITANEKAKEIESILIKRIRIESERLSLFQRKWSDYVSNMLSQMQVDKRLYSVESYLNTAKDELAMVLNKHFGLPIERPSRDVNEQFKSETDRLTRRNYRFDWAEAEPSDTLAKPRSEFNVSDDTSATTTKNEDYPLPIPNGLSPTDATIFDENMKLGFKTYEPLESILKDMV